MLDLEVPEAHGVGGGPVPEEVLVGPHSVLHEHQTKIVRIGFEVEWIGIRPLQKPGSNHIFVWYKETMDPTFETIYHYLSVFLSTRVIFFYPYPD